MLCEQTLKLSENLLLKDGQTVIEAAMRIVGVELTARIFEESLRTKLHKSELVESQVFKAYVEVGLDPELVDELLAQPPEP